MRCCALLRGICVLEDAGLGILAGILGRQHWETWLLSLHVLLRRDEALQEVLGDDVFHKRRLAERFDLGSEYLPDWDGKVARLNVMRLAESLGPLLIEADEDSDTTVAIVAYDWTYRLQSMYSVHAGLGTIKPYIRTGEASSSVEPNPLAPFDDIGQISALYTLHLAKYVFEHFGIATDGLDAAWDRLRADKNSDAMKP